MKHRNSHLLVGYWSRLRKGRDVPDQTDIDPRAIKRMLSFVFIIDACDIGRPMYRLAGTSLCDRFGIELKGTNFLSHWDAQSRAALTTLLRQSLATRQPVCLSSIAATAEHGMVELETILAPVTFGQGQPLRFIGLVQVLSDPSPLAGRPIAYERLVGSQLVREDEPLSNLDVPPPPMPPMITDGRSHPRAPHLRLVVSQDRPVTLHCDLDAPMQRLIEALDILALPVERTA
ncbi:MAG: PAS domain-containing protein [Rhizomicrobium sp.]